MRVTTMKTTTAAVLAALVVPPTHAFVPTTSNVVAAALSLDSFDPSVLVAGAAAVLGGIGVAVSNQGGEASTSAAKKVVDEPEVEPVDVSIPYNAAAQVYYESNGFAKNNVDFGTFETAYLEKAVAEVTAKKVEQDAQRTIATAQKAAKAAADKLEALK